MKFLGVFQNHNLPKIDMPKLFAYVDSREVIVSYNKEQPFYVEQVSILIDREYQTYAVFECGFMCSSDEDAKSFGKNFTQALIDFLRYYQENCIFGLEMLYFYLFSFGLLKISCIFAACFKR